MPNNYIPERWYKLLMDKLLAMNSNELDII